MSTMSGDCAERVIYWGSGSTPAWKALACLEEKGLAYDSKRIDPSKGEVISRFLPFACLEISGWIFMSSSATYLPAVLSVYDRRQA